MFRRRNKRLKERFEKIENISKMLKEEGKQDGECSAFEITAKEMVTLLDSLVCIRFMLCIVIGFIAGKIITCALQL